MEGARERERVSERLTRRWRRKCPPTLGRGGLSVGGLEGRCVGVTLRLRGVLRARSGGDALLLCCCGCCGCCALVGLSTEAAVLGYLARFQRGWPIRAVQKG